MGATVRVWITWDGTEIDITNSTLDEQGRLSNSTTSSYDVAEMLEDATKRAMSAVQAYVDDLSRSGPNGGEHGMAREDPQGSLVCYCGLAFTDSALFEDHVRKGW